jgi:hypothetical protein
MPRVIQRKTQTAEYWQDFSLTPFDIAFLHTLLLDAERPASTQALAEAVVAERCRREETELRAELSRGVLYQPKKRFKLGDKVIFPALEFRLGEIIDVRRGQNTEYGDFEVISVDFGPDRRQRSFAAGLAAPHKLNVEADLLISGDVQPSVLLKQSPRSVTLKPQLTTGLRHSRIAGSRGLLADIHRPLEYHRSGYRMRNAPVSTTRSWLNWICRRKSNPVLAFSLNSACADGASIRSGRRQTPMVPERLEPTEALTSRRLRAPIPYAAIRRPATCFRWSGKTMSGAQILEPAAAVRVCLNPCPRPIHLFRHLRSTGTPPFPQRIWRTSGVTPSTPMGQRFIAWVCMADVTSPVTAWYEQHKLRRARVLERR